MVSVLQSSLQVSWTPFMRPSGSRKVISGVSTAKEKGPRTTTVVEAFLVFSDKIENRISTNRCQES